jgi:hypothetical protein
MAVTTVAIVIAVMFARAYRFNSNPVQARQAVSVGSRFGMNNAIWQGGGKNMILALSTTCHFFSPTLAIDRPTPGWSKSVWYAEVGIGGEKGGSVRD